MVSVLGALVLYGEYKHLPLFSGAILAAVVVPLVFGDTHDVRLCRDKQRCADLVAEADKPDRRMNLGIAFQLVDDALDYAGREATLGKTVGDAFREGKITLPIILAFLRGRTVEREFWKRTIEKLDQREGDLEQAKVLLDRHGLAAARHPG